MSTVHKSCFGKGDSRVRLRFTLHDGRVVLPVDDMVGLMNAVLSGRPKHRHGPQMKELLNKYIAPELKTRAVIQSKGEDKVLPAITFDALFGWINGFARGAGGMLCPPPVLANLETLMLWLIHELPHIGETLGFSPPELAKQMTGECVVVQ